MATTIELIEEQFFSGEQTEVWIGTEVLTPQNPKPTMSLIGFQTGGAPVNNEIGTVNVKTGLQNGSSILIPAAANNYRFVLPSNQVVVVDASDRPITPGTGTRRWLSETATSNGTTRKCKPLVSTLLSGGSSTPSTTETTYIDMLPLYSVSSGSFDSSTSGTKKFRNVGDGAYATLGKKDLEGKIDLSGYVCRDDSMRRILRQAASSTTKFVYVRMIFPDQEGIECFCEVTSAKRPFETDAEYKGDYSLVLKGSPTFIDFTPR
jgi:hypothetical protein